MQPERLGGKYNDEAKKKKKRGNSKGNDRLLETMKHC